MAKEQLLATPPSYRVTGTPNGTPGSQALHRRHESETVGCVMFKWEGCLYFGRWCEGIIPNFCGGTLISSPGMFYWDSVGNNTGPQWGNVARRAPFTKEFLDALPDFAATSDGWAHSLLGKGANPGSVMALYLAAAICVSPKHTSRTTLSAYGPTRAAVPSAKKLTLARVNEKLARWHDSGKYAAGDVFSWAVPFFLKHRSRIKVTTVAGWHGHSDYVDMSAVCLDSPSVRLGCTPGRNLRTGSLVGAWSLTMTEEPRGQRPLSTTSGSMMHNAIDRESLRTNRTEWKDRGPRGVLPRNYWRNH